MRLAVRILIALISIGWLLPFTYAFLSVWDFEYRVLRGVVIANDTSVVTPFHMVQFAKELYLIAAGWVAIVIVGWSFYLTRRQS